MWKMSTDFDIVCDACKVYHHLGQQFTSGFTFGYGTGDTEEENAIGEFIQRHFNHSKAGMRVVLTDAINPECTSDGFEEESCPT